MGGGKNSDVVICWPTADLGFMDPVVAVNVLFGVKRGDDQFDELVEQISRDSAAWGLAALHETQYLIDPRETRDLLLHLFPVHSHKKGCKVGLHRLSNWPTSY
jgi:acetyl-CoA carboxylase carboxyltransferase component